VRRAALPRVVTFGRLEAVSLLHSCIYAALIVSAIVGGSGASSTYILGWSHGLLWIGMSLVCLAAARARIIPFWLAVCVAVLGGIGPFFGSVGFVRESRRRNAAAPATAGVVGSISDPDGGRNLKR
jgi:hypothetical protein